MYGLLVLTVTFAMTSLFRRKSDSHSGPIRGYLLAANELTRFRVMNLLWATSFSVNGMLYQTYLGYKIGLYALITQVAWAASFFWVSRYIETIRRSDSMHGALEHAYHSSIRPIAGILSILSAMALIGWEFNVLESTFEGLITKGNQSPINQGSLIAVGVIASCVLYTIMGGMRANAVADMIQSVLKILGFTLLLGLLIANFMRSGEQAFAQHPKFDEAVAFLTIGGLLTNLAFSITWQFVDMSTWQNIISGNAKSTPVQAASVMRRSGVLTFIAPGILGTFLGIFLMPVAGVDEGNSVAKAVEVLQPLNAFIALLVFLAIAAAAMSMIDGLLLVSGYTLIMDIVNRRSSLDDLDRDKESAYRILGFVRISFVALAIFGVWGISYLMKLFGLSEFMILYVVVVPAMSLVGPIYIMLIGRAVKTRYIAIAPITAVAVGMILIAMGDSWPMWAGTGALVSSMLLTQGICALTRRSRMAIRGRGE
jgi:Na+/proline symporter